MGRITTPTYERRKTPEILRQVKQHISVYKTIKRNGPILRDFRFSDDGGSKYL
jgi:hypothetical protein